MAKQYQGPMRLAHRGVTQAAPENTLEAFEAAKNMGLEGIEIDVRLTRDGQVVVVHDANLTRLTLGHPAGQTHARVADLSWEELSRVEIPYANHLLDKELPPYSWVEEIATLMPHRLLGQDSGRGYLEELQREPRMARLMLFQEFLAWLEKAPHMTVEIEIKVPEAVLPIFRLLDASPVGRQCILFSGQSDVMQELMRAAAHQGTPKEVRLGANIRWLTPEMKEWLSANRLYEVGMNAGAADEDIAWLQSKGIQVFSNLGDYPDWWGKICRLNVAAFKTNYAEAYTKWWHSQNNTEEQS